MLCEMPLASRKVSQEVKGTTMGYIKKQDVIASIKTRVQKLHDTHYTIFEAYLGTDPFTRKPVRMAAKNKEKLVSNITTFYKRLSAGGDFAVLLNAQQSLDARKAIDLLREHGITASLTQLTT